MLSDWLEEPAMLVLIQAVLLTVPAIVLAAVFRMIGIPGGKGAAAVCGGLLAGVLMGSLVLGGSAPQLYEPVVIGAQQEREALQEAEAERESELEAAVAALQRTGVSEIAFDEMEEQIRAKYEPRIDAARETLADAETAHTRRLSILLAVLGGMVFASGYFRRTRSEISEKPRPQRSAERSVAKVCGNFPPAPVELLMLVSAAAVPAILARWLLGLEIPVAIAFGLVLAVPGATVRRGAHTMSGGWAFLIAALVISVCATAAFGTATGSTVLVGSAMVFSVALLLIDNGLLRTRQAEIRFHDAVFYALLFPALAGALTTLVDLEGLVSTGAFWIALVIGLIASGDGRWLGYWLSVRHFAEPPVKRGSASIANSMISAGAPTLQLVLAVMAFRAEPAAGSLIFAAVAGAALLELTRSLRARMARSLDDMLEPIHDTSAPQP